MRIKTVMKAVFANAKKKGFHETKLNLWKALGNLHSEVSEAWEELRMPDFSPKRIYYKPNSLKPLGLPIEFADLVIRVFDDAQALRIDLEEAIRIKMAYNATRPHRHGNKRS